jgi:hypothetical protein
MYPDSKVRTRDAGSHLVLGIEIEDAPPGSCSMPLGFSSRQLPAQIPSRVELSILFNALHVDRAVRNDLRASHFHVFTFEPGD